jgi:S1-C subfamily serine protease
MVRFAAAALALASGVLCIPAHSAEIVLLDFWSRSCGPCMQMKPTVRSFVNAGYPIREVDVTRDVQLARDHKVDRIPCFVMLVDNQEVDRVVGFTSSERLQQMFKRAGEAAKRNADRTRQQSPDTPTPLRTAAPGIAALGDDPVNSVPVETTSESYDHLLASTVRLKVDDAKGHSYGTGTIIDSRSGQALVITCGHLFRESAGKGPLSVELFERVPGGVRAAGEVPAQLIGYDLDRDLALVGIWPKRAVTVAAVAPQGAAVDRGHRVVSIGCSNGKDPTALATRITTVDRYKGPPNVQASGAPVEGRSGGGLFNEQGQLIGVCFAADHEGNEGLYAALESIHEELAENGLSGIYSQAGPAAAPMTPIVRGQEPLEVVVPVPDSQPAMPPANVVVQPTGAAAAPQGLSAVEQAAWDEIMARAATAEVICIIRPKEAGGQSEVITLNDVSPEFVRALAERQRKPQPLIVR